MSAAMSWKAAFAIVALAACSDEEPPIRATPPDAPAANDPAYAAHDLRSWYLVGDGLTDGQNDLQLVVDAPAGTGYIDAWFVMPDGSTSAGMRLSPTQNANQFVLQTSIADFAAGDYAVILAADGKDANAKLAFHRSMPLYVMVSTDWDFSDPGDTALGYHAYLRTRHPSIKYTHFAGPYTFTDPAVKADRRTELANWLLAQQAKGDEIGLHIHPYCNFVTDAVVTCNVTQSTVYTQDDSGYTIMLGAYNRTDFGTLL